jgi:DNA-binding LytR/AlgR family response regulator
MKILIIEDEAPAARRLVSLIRGTEPGADILDTIDSVQSAVKWLQTHRSPDLIFMDIQLADGLSFDIFSQVEVQAPVIFTTAYDEYALKAFKVNSVDYLLKPIEPEELHNSLLKLQKMRDQFASPLDQQVLRSLVQSLQPGQPQFKNRFLVRFADKLVFIQAEDIAYFRAEDKYVFILTRENKKYPLDHTLDELDSLLDPAIFFRLNRQFIANLRSIQSIHSYFNGKLKLHLQPAPEEEVTVSRERSAAFKKWLGA